MPIVTARQQAEKSGLSKHRLRFEGWKPEMATTMDSRLRELEAFVGDMIDAAATLKALSLNVPGEQGELLADYAAQISARAEHLRHSLGHPVEMASD